MSDAARVGTLTDWTAAPFAAGGITHDVYERGSEDLRIAGVPGVRNRCPAPVH